MKSLQLLINKSKSYAAIQKASHKDKHQYNERSPQENLQKTQIQQYQNGYIKEKKKKIQVNKI